MNKKRRKEIMAALDVINEQSEVLFNLLSEEEDYFHNMPENLLGSDNATKTEELICLIDDSIGEINEGVENIKVNL